ncbi:hypothetical protein G8764_05270 [Pseudomaricurvus alcaniphilus]|uniref:hypothetical protein n=1 Tax=Pseudomaricurvus alcaniphilus TaxID=1166482 RepID=UPI00140B56C3|nr:hypothetical protein [Pseudomaricurvus alcaniphilus]NHN36699.1 hypothetical protein [Pseudomaricurvus alcaniphilus]
MSLSGHFVAAEPGRVFVTAWQAGPINDVAVICVPPALEELNASRRQLVVQAQGLVSGGVDAFIMDYFGTGDSEGLDYEASFESWQQSLQAVFEWVLKLGYKSIILWGVRIGCLVIADFLTQKPRSEVAGILFWQPLESGKHWITALQRLQLLARKRDKNDQEFEVAGYQLSEALLEPVRNFEWGQYQACLQQYPLEIILVSPPANLSERMQQIFSSARSINQVAGTPFWSIPESPVNRVLESQTLMQLQAMASTDKAGQNA